mgnify:CR=1 FL=1
MSPYSNHKVFWKCIYGHSWNASIDSRTLKESGCRHCRSRTSRFEIFILCELRSIFKEVVWRRKFEGVEADIYLVSENIAIEVDGEHWHKHKIELDRAKSELFEKLGIKLIRVRSSALPSIKGLQILYPRNQDDFEIVIELFELLSEEIDNSNLQQYLLEKVRKGEQEYKEIISSDGGKVDRYEDWGNLKLAYNINKNNKAHYILMNFQANNKALDELTNLIKFNDSIIRHMILSKNKAITEPSIMMASKDRI